MNIVTYRVYVIECDRCGATAHAQTDSGGEVATGMQAARGDDLGFASYRYEVERDLRGLGWRGSKCPDCAVTQ